MSWKDIPGRCAYLWIYDEWIASRPRTGAVVVEVGVALGKSLAYLCEALDKAGRGDVEVYAVDAWGRFARNGEQQAHGDAAGGDFLLYARTMLANAPQAFERIRVIRTLSTCAPKLFAGGHEGVDLVVLDADHTYAWVKAELEAWGKVLRAGGWIGGDDHHPQEYPGVVRACEEAFPEGYAVRERDGGWDWPTWLKRPGGRELWGSAKP